MQTGGALQGANTIPRRSRPNALLAGVAVLTIAALVALMVWVGPFGVGGVETRDAVPAAGAGTAVVHDDAGNMPPELYYPLPHGKVARPDANTGTAIVHDDAGNLNSGAGTVIIHDDAGNVNPAAGTTVVHDDAGSVNR